MPGGGARGQSLEHLQIFFFHFFSCMELFILEQLKVLFGVDSLSLLTSNLEFSALGWGKGSKSRTS